MKINDKKIIISIIAAVILIIIVTTLVIINKENRKEKDNTTNNNSSNEEILERADYYDVVNYLKLNTLPDDYYGYFYKTEKTNQSDIKNNIKLYMALRKVISDNNLGDSNSKIEIKESDVTKALKSIFGSKVEYKHESLTGNTCSYTNFKYDKSSKTYIQESDECIEPRTDTILYEIIDTQESDTELKIQEKVAYIETSYNLETKKIVYNIYKDIKKEEKVATVENYSIDSCKDLLNTYQYTFKKDNSNYYLETVEIIK